MHSKRCYYDGGTSYKLKHRVEKDSIMPGDYLYVHYIYLYPLGMRYIAHALNGHFRGKINCHGRNVGFIEIDKPDNSGNIIGSHYSQ
jgi:hypothetical protein